MSDPAFALCSLASDVLSAEAALAEQLIVAQGVLESATRGLAKGRQINSLGILQASGTILDAKAATYEASVQAFKTAWAYLEDHFDDPTNPEATTKALREQLERHIQASPRLQSVTFNPSKRSQ